MPSSTPHVSFCFSYFICENDEIGERQAKIEIFSEKKNILKYRQIVCGGRN